MGQDSNFGDSSSIPDHQLLWSESPTRWLVEVAPEHVVQFEAALGDVPWARVGTVTAEPQLVISGMAGDEILRADVMALKQAWQQWK